MTTTTTIPADAVVELLVSEGYATADVLATVDSLIEAGVESDDNSLTEADIQVCRDQLDADGKNLPLRYLYLVADALGVPAAVLYAAAGAWKAGMLPLPELDQATIDAIEQGRQAQR